MIIPNEEFYIVARDICNKCRLYMEAKTTIIKQPCELSEFYHKAMIAFQIQKREKLNTGGLK